MPEDRQNHNPKIATPDALSESGVGTPTNESPPPSEPLVRLPPSTPDSASSETATLGSASSSGEPGSSDSASRLRPFGSRQSNDGPAALAIDPSSSPLGATIHSGTDSVAALDLTPPGQSTANLGGNAVARGLSKTWAKLSSLWKRIPPLEDIFDSLLAAMGFQRKPASMLRRAQTLSAKGRYAESIKWFRDILYLRPLTIAAYDGLGRVYFRMGLVEEANREFTIADSLERLVNNRDDLDAACSLAKALLERKQAKMAVSLLEPVLVAHFYSPNNGDLLKRMGLLYGELRATKKLHQVYEAGLVQHPEDHEFYLLKGNLEVKLGRVAEGERLLRWGRLMGRLQDNPNDLNANMAFGELCLKENKTTQGLDYLRNAATLAPDNSGIRWRLFNLYQKQGNYPEALRFFQEVVAIEPDNEELKYKLSDFYRKNRYYDESLEILRQLAAKHPRDPRPRSVMSSVLSETGQLEEAQNLKTLAETLAIGLKPEPDHRETVIFMNYLFSNHQNAEATEWLNRGLAKWPYHGELIITKVKILYNEYRYKEAVNLLKRLTSVKHDMAEPHMWMALCYQRLGNHMAALAEAQLATRLAPKSFTSHKVLGDILKEQKKISQANASYEVADMIRLTQSKAASGSSGR